MPKIKKDEEATGVANLDTSSLGDSVKYWSPEHEELIIGADRTAMFRNHTLVVSAESAKVVDQLSGIGRLFYKVHSKSGDEAYKEAFLKFLRNLIGGDPSDQVKAERGLIAVMALFSLEELVELDISKSSPNEDRLILAAINNKYVEGIV